MMSCYTLSLCSPLRVVERKEEDADEARERAFAKCNLLLEKGRDPVRGGPESDGRVREFLLFLLLLPRLCIVAASASAVSFANGRGELELEPRRCILVAVDPGADAPPLEPDEHLEKLSRERVSARGGGAPGANGGGGVGLLHLHRFGAGVLLRLSLRLRFLLLLGAEGFERTLEADVVPLEREELRLMVEDHLAKLRHFHLSCSQARLAILDASL
mmetsp:Transcript_20271/g.65969  ORF Transcript_20271/g.65969 Transcript_20271/m.65969 type:complete len:216 (-) Transcript_20271:778-1425(-)